jgi:polyisoprenyl-phosphate glycosyltransferase
MATIINDTPLTDSPPVISVVIPAYNEEENIGEMSGILAKVLDSTGLKWEVLFVDDGSSDNTWKTIHELRRTYPSIKGIKFSRNFGHQYALYAGLSFASGDAIICMDADLQHPPEIIPQLIHEWNKGNKIVNTVRIENEHVTAFKKYTSRQYYKIFSFLTGVKIEQGMADFRLLDRQVLNTLLGFGEEGLFLRGIVQWVGFPSTRVPFQCRERFSGNTKYTFKKMIKFAISGITSFSVIPLRIGILIGIITSFIAFGFIVYAVYSKVVLNATVPGWATTITITSFMFGILFILLGLLGEYIGRILIEVRRRPRYIIQDTIGIQEPVADMTSHTYDTRTFYTG